MGGVKLPPINQKISGVADDGYDFAPQPPNLGDLGGVTQTIKMNYILIQQRQISLLFLII